MNADSSENSSETSAGKSRGIILIVLILVVVGAASTLLIDWRFWYRWHTLPEDPGEWPASYYKPTAVLDGAPTAFFPVASQDARTIDEKVLHAAATWAEAHNSAALLVLHKGVIQHEQYWQGIGPDSLFTGRAMTRSLIAPLIAIAMQEGSIESVDDPAGRYLPEWSADPRGDITLRQLLHNLSGLENAPLANDPDPNNKNSRLALGGDFRKAALAYDLENTPGEFFALANTNAQILGAILESATGEDYEDFLDNRLWSRIGAGEASMYMDSPGGMPAVYCCFRATTRDWLRYGAALLNDGEVAGQQLWPSGWVAEMTQGSEYYPLYGYQIWTGNPPPGGERMYVEGWDLMAPHGEGIRADEVFYLEGGGYRTMYVLPQQDLVILRLGYYDADWNFSTIPNLILSGLGDANSTLESPLGQESGDNESEQ